MAQMSLATFPTEIKWSRPKWALGFTIKPEPQPDPPLPGDPVTYRKYRNNRPTDFILETSEVAHVIVYLGANRDGVHNFRVETLDGTEVTVAIWRGHEVGILFWKKRAWIQVDWSGGYFNGY